MNTEVLNNVMKKGSAVALGLFDGVHLGHRAVIDEAIECRKYGFVPAVFTFDTSSVSMKHGKDFSYIYNNDVKKEIFTGMGIEYVYAPNFYELRELSAEDFVKKILCDKLNAKIVISGTNFHFGKNAFGNVEELIHLGYKYGFETRTVSPIRYDGKVISSDSIRQFLKDGDIKTANVLLGGKYFIKEIVEHGNQIGRTLNFPTINQYYGERQVLPRFGVYASRVKINGVSYLSITNIGIKPTVGNEKRPLAETYIIDYDGDLYGKEMKVSLISFMRDEQKFSSIEELKNMINRDTNARHNIKQY